MLGSPGKAAPLPAGSGGLVPSLLKAQRKLRSDAVIFYCGLNSQSCSCATVVRGSGLSFFNCVFFYVFIWLYRILVAARGTFSL